MNPTTREKAHYAAMSGVQTVALPQLRPLGCDEIAWLKMALVRCTTHEAYLSRSAKAARMAALLEIMEITGCTFLDDTARHNAISDFPELYQGERASIPKAMRNGADAETAAGTIGESEMDGLVNGWEKKAGEERRAMEVHDAYIAAHPKLSPSPNGEVGGLRLGADAEQTGADGRAKVDASTPSHAPKARKPRKPKAKKAKAKREKKVKSVTAPMPTDPGEAIIDDPTAPPPLEQAA